MTKRALLMGMAAGAALATGVAVFVSTAAPALAPWTLDPTDASVSLDDVEREVIRRFGVPDIAPSTLAGMLARGRATLFDVRTQAEFDAGHLQGAIRIEPGTSADEILRLHRDKLDDGPVIFYCAVGVRSSQMMRQTLRQIEPHAKAGAYNLRGGVFRWTADGRALVQGNQPGRAHPFDANWGQLLARTVPGP